MCYTILTKRRVSEIKKVIISILNCMLFVTSFFLTSAGILGNTKNFDKINNLIVEKESKLET
jgi:hypothetical protein